MVGPQPEPPGSSGDCPTDGGSPGCTCNPSVVVGRVVRGNPYVSKDAHTSDAMPDSVPPSKTYEVTVVVSNWSGACSGKKIDLAIINGSGDNGTATISPATISGSGTFKVTVTGGDQTKPGHGHQLKIQAKFEGAVKAESDGFTVCAHPVNYTDTFVSDIDSGGVVGVRVQDGWDSDSGTFADLNEAEDSEQVEYDAPTSPPYSGAGGAKNSGYLPANRLTQDSHTIGRPTAGPAATWERRQVCIFKCHRCGATDKPHPNSGFKIVHYVFKDAAGNWQHHARKFGAKVSARGYTSEAGSANVTSLDHALP